MMNTPATVKGYAALSTASLPTSLAEILYTSGATGKPKGCVLTHQSVALAAITVASAVSISHDERTLIAMPIWHSSPLNNWFGATVYVGGTVVLLREYEPRRFLETVQAFQPARTAVECQGRHRFAVVPCRIAGPITAVTHFLRGAIAP